jgi:hypothetical protein
MMHAPDLCAVWNPLGCGSLAATALAFVGERETMQWRRSSAPVSPHEPVGSHGDDKSAEPRCIADKCKFEKKVPREPPVPKDILRSNISLPPGHAEQRADAR